VNQKDCKESIEEMLLAAERDRCLLYLFEWYPHYFFHSYTLLYTRHFPAIVLPDKKGKRRYNIVLNTSSDYKAKKQFSAKGAPSKVQCSFYH
jgi:hypothetical protein